MNKRLIFVMLFALVVSAAASLILYRMISTQVANNAKASTVRLLVAAHTLDIGALVKDGDVKMADWGGAIPPGAITKPEDAVGRGIIQPIYEGEPILESRVAAKGAGHISVIAADVGAAVLLRGRLHDVQLDRHREVVQQDRQDRDALAHRRLEIHAGEPDGGVAPDVDA